MITQPDRQSYIDWLRTGAMFLLVFYHTGRLFDFEPWHIKNADLNYAIHVFNRFLDVWQMPLFFLLAGSSVWFALGSRRPREFARERLFRLFVPLVFGMLVIVPPQVYFERVFDGDFTGSFIAWYPNTFHGAYNMDSPGGNLSWHHLWFLAYLLVFSMLLLPLFMYFRRQDKAALVSSIARFLARPGAIFLPAILLVVYNLTLRPIYGWGNQNLISDWANFFFYSTVFFCGFFMVSDSQIISVLQRAWLAALVTAVFSGAATYLLQSGTVRMPAVVADGASLTLNAVGGWCSLVAIAGLGSKSLNFSGGLLRYASDAVLPVYILHQTVIVTLGFYVVQWDMAVAAKYFFIVAATFLISLTIYELVRRLNVTRFLFGIKARKTRYPETVQAEARRLSAG